MKLKCTLEQLNFELNSKKEAKDKSKHMQVGRSGS